MTSAKYAALLKSLRREFALVRYAATGTLEIMGDLRSSVRRGPRGADRAKIIGKREGRHG